MRGPRLTAINRGATVQGTVASVSADRTTPLPWNAQYYPSSMRHLGEFTRAKAIEIANALLAEGMEEGKAIRIAIAKAKEWARRHAVPLRDDE